MENDLAPSDIGYGPSPFSSWSASTIASMDSCSSASSQRSSKQVLIDTDGQFNVRIMIDSPTNLSYEQEVDILHESNVEDLVQHREFSQEGCENEHLQHPNTPPPLVEVAEPHVEPQPINDNGDEESVSGDSTTTTVSAVSSGYGDETLPGSLSVDHTSESQQQEPVDEGIQELSDSYRPIVMEIGGSQGSGTSIEGSILAESVPSASSFTSDVVSSSLIIGHYSSKPSSSITKDIQGVKSELNDSVERIPSVMARKLGSDDLTGALNQVVNENVPGEDDTEGVNTKSNLDASGETTFDQEYQLEIEEVEARYLAEPDFESEEDTLSVVITIASKSSKTTNREQSIGSCVEDEHLSVPATLLSENESAKDTWFTTTAPEGENVQQTNINKDSSDMFVPLKGTTQSNIAVLTQETKQSQKAVEHCENMIKQNYELAIREASQQYKEQRQKCADDKFEEWLKLPKGGNERSVEDILKVYDVQKTSFNTAMYGTEDGPRVKDVVLLVEDADDSEKPSQRLMGLFEERFAMYRNRITELEGWAEEVKPYIKKKKVSSKISSESRKKMVNDFQHKIDPKSSKTQRKSNRKAGDNNDQIYLEKALLGKTKVDPAVIKPQLDLDGKNPNDDVSLEPVKKCSTKQKLRMKRVQAKSRPESSGSSRAASGISRDNSLYRSNRFVLKSHCCFGSVKSGPSPSTLPNEGIKKNLSNVKSSGYGGKYAALNKDGQNKVRVRGSKTPEAVRKVFEPPKTPPCRIPTPIVGQFPALSKDHIKSQEKVSQWLGEINGGCKIPMPDKQLERKITTKDANKLPTIPASPVMVEGASNKTDGIRLPTMAEADESCYITNKDDEYFQLHHNPSLYCESIDRSSRLGQPKLDHPNHPGLNQPRLVQPIVANAHTDRARDQPNNHDGIASTKKTKATPSLVPSHASVIKKQDDCNNKSDYVTSYNRPSKTNVLIIQNSEEPLNREGYTLYKSSLGASPLSVKNIGQPLNDNIPFIQPSITNALVIQNSEQPLLKNELESKAVRQLFLIDDGNDQHVSVQPFRIDHESSQIKQYEKQVTDSFQRIPMSEDASRPSDATTKPLEVASKRHKKTTKRKGSTNEQQHAAHSKPSNNIEAATVQEPNPRKTKDRRLKSAKKLSNKESTSHYNRKKQDGSLINDYAANKKFHTNKIAAEPLAPVQERFSLPIPVPQALCQNVMQSSEASCIARHSRKTLIDCKLPSEQYHHMPAVSAYIPRQTEKTWSPQHDDQMRVKCQLDITITPTPPSRVRSASTKRTRPKTGRPKTAKPLLINAPEPDRVSTPFPTEEDVTNHQALHEGLPRLNHERTKLMSSEDHQTRDKSRNRYQKGADKKSVAFSQNLTIKYSPIPPTTDFTPRSMQQGEYRLQSQPAQCSVPIVEPRALRIDMPRADIPALDLGECLSPDNSPRKPSSTPVEFPIFDLASCVRRPRPIFVPPLDLDKLDENETSRKNGRKRAARKNKSKLPPKDNTAGETQTLAKRAKEKKRKSETVYREADSTSIGLNTFDSVSIKNAQNAPERPKQGVASASDTEKKTPRLSMSSLSSRFLPCRLSFGNKRNKYIKHDDNEGHDDNTSEQTPKPPSKPRDDKTTKRSFLRRRQ